MAEPTIPAPSDDKKVVELRREAPEAAKASDDFEAKYRERRDADDEVKALREKAARADALEAERESLRQQAPPVQRYYEPPRPPIGPPQRGPDMNRWRELARIDPGAAYMEMEQYRQQQQIARDNALRAETAQAILQANQYSAQAQAGHEWLRSELPEVFDGRSSLQKRAVEIYNSDPWYQSRGDGHVRAAKEAAAELGIGVKSKRRPEPAVATERDSDDQNVERGTRKPPRAERDDDAPLTAAQKKTADSMGIDPKKYATMLRARKNKQDVVAR